MDQITGSLFSSPEAVQQAPNQSNVDLKFALEEIFSARNLEMKTDLTVRQINAITRGQLFAKEFKSKLMSDLCRKFMILMVSKNRMGRKEFAEMSRSVHQDNKEQETIAKRLLGV